MGYNKINYARIREEYSTKYLIARENAELRLAEVQAAIPEIRELDRALNRTGLSIMEATLNNKDPEAAIRRVRAENEELQRRRRLLLVSHGYPADYTDVRYECPLCGDSGYVNFSMCTCMKKRLIEAGYESSGMGTLIRTQTFANFSLDYYQDPPDTHRRMSRLFETVKTYAHSFQPGVSGSLAFFGNTGLGKTHLSSAVARTVIDLGHDVCYVSSVSLFSDFEFQRFGSGVAEDSGIDPSRYYDCDLLIIDDLGAEVTNKFTTSVLYNIINTRLNRHKSTIISTNCSIEGFRKQYWDRITSRVFGEFLILPFEGSDIRSRKLAGMTVNKKGDPKA